MTSDAELKRSVIAALAADPAADPTAIGVAVKDGVVTLCGYLASDADKQAVERAVRRVQQVKAVAIELDVHRSPGHGACDAEIADKAERMLRWTTVDPDGFRVAVDHGWVTLQGEAGYELERCSVENSIRLLPGVTGVTNQIAVGRGSSQS
jgi:osmotically-inducible protein OsmY